MIKHVICCTLVNLIFINTAYADGNRLKPSAKNQTKCENLVKKYGGRSFDFNHKWYGKGVKRPSTSSWHLARIKEPAFFSNELVYVYEQETSDGFVHTAWCKWTEYDFKMYVERFDYGPVLMYPGVE